MYFLWEFSHADRFTSQSGAQCFQWYVNTLLTKDKPKQGVLESFFNEPDKNDRLKKGRLEKTLASKQGDSFL